MDDQHLDAAPAPDTDAGAPPQEDIGAAAARTFPSRRQFLTGALAFGGMAWSGLSTAGAAPGSAAAAPADELLPQDPTDGLKIGEIVRSRDGKLRGTITMLSGGRMLPGATSPTMLRYLQGKNAQGRVVWPLLGGIPAPPAMPGPTLRARVGDVVELTFLNHVDVAQFGRTLDRVEQGLDAGCQRAVDGGSGKEVYPGVASDTTVRSAHDQAPNCFHGSSTTNIHFHGTHVTPDGLGDNVLLQLHANPNVTEDSVRAEFDLIFQAGPPDEWNDLPRSYRERQLGLLKEYDDSAPWQGRNGSPGNPALPPEARLLPPTEAAIRRGQWPQYLVGAYPYNFRLTPYAEDAQGNPIGYAMGQAPGTHWYHAHKHGSTAINVYNGMAGVFIIEGDYDDTLKRLYPGLVEKVLIVQNLADAPGLMRGGTGASQTLYVNGRATPTLTMRPGQVQLWRLVNASVRSVTTLLGFVPKGSTSPTAPMPEMRQTAQDGVQFRWENFRDQPRLRPGATDPARANAFATGNRVDLLVKAPLGRGTWDFQVNDINNTKRTLFSVTVEGSPTDGDFPTERQYPAFPPFLKDIPEADVRIFRRMVFGWEKGRATAPLSRTAGAPKFMIDGRQFEGGHYDQTMVLGDTEEWTIYNTTAGIAHPFHIHVNPFQVVEVYDPATDLTYKPASNFVWQDVVAIPPSKLDAQGNVIGKAGYVKIRQRFVDFTGSFVLHCHMLAHEDRGMMQLLRVISPRADVPHH